MRTIKGPTRMNDSTFRPVPDALFVLFRMAAGAIKMGAGEVFICGGVESMTRVPMMGFNPLPNPEFYARMPSAYIGMGDTADVWFRYVTTITGTVEANTCGAGSLMSRSSSRTRLRRSARSTGGRVGVMTFMVPPHLRQRLVSP